MTDLPAHYRPTKVEALRSLGLAALFWAAVGYLFYRSALPMLLLTGLAWPTYLEYRRQFAQKKRDLLTDQFRDLLYSLSASFAAGRQMREGLLEATEHMRLIYGETGLITLELKRMATQMKQSGASEEASLWDFASRSGSRDILNFVDVCSVCRQTGGNLMRVVAKAAEVLLAQIEIKREIRKLTAQKRFEVTIIAAIPLVLLLFLQLTSPAYLDVMYQTGVGRGLMTLALTVMVGAYVWSVRICHIEI